MRKGEGNDRTERAEANAAALRLAELGVAVVPGARITRAGTCSCGNPNCRVPGRHPLDPAWLFQASTSPSAVAGWWRDHPGANIVAPLLGPFHVVDVPAQLGRLMLARLDGHPGLTGPIAMTPEGRYHFWTVPGVAIELDVLFDRRGYSAAAMDLHVHREGSYVLLPPSSLGPFAEFRWKMPPRAHVRELPGSATLLRLVLEGCRELLARTG